MAISFHGRCILRREGTFPSALRKREGDAGSSSPALYEDLTLGFSLLFCVWCIGMFFQVAVMRMCNHKNVLSCYASFVHENELWLVMEFMSKGSCLHVMNVAKKEVRI